MDELVTYFSSLLGFSIRVQVKTQNSIADFQSKQKLLSWNIDNNSSISPLKNHSCALL